MPDRWHLPGQDVIDTVAVSVGVGLSTGWPVWGWVVLALSVPTLIQLPFRTRSFTVDVLTPVGIMTFSSDSASA